MTAAGIACGSIRRASMKVRILRQRTPEDEPYWEEFNYDGPENNTVAGLLDYINYNDDIVNTKGEITARIGWENSCLQGVCGACAMVVNDKPVLACQTFIKDLGGTVTIRPLRKFPVIHDLIVDRSSIQQNLVEDNVYIGEYNPLDAMDQEQDYISAKCLKCGLCMEVCPNYVNGKNFFGGAFANDCYLVSERNREKSKEINKVYGKHFGKSCSKALSCMKVCSVGISHISVIAKLNKRW